MCTIKFRVDIEEFSLRIRRNTTLQKGIERIFVRMDTRWNPERSTTVTANVGAATLCALLTVNTYIFGKKLKILGRAWVQVSAHRVVNKAMRHQLDSGFELFRVRRYYLHIDLLMNIGFGLAFVL